MDFHAGIITRSDNILPKVVCEKIKMNLIETKIETADLDSRGQKPKLCRLCHTPQIGSNEVRPNGLRGCKCPELSPHYKLQGPVHHVQSIEEDSEALEPKNFLNPQHEEKNITDDLSLKNTEPRSEENIESLNNCIFTPPQGMDAGQYPRGLFYQYYQNKNKIYTFDVLPLSFSDQLNYQGMRALSMNNNEIRENWQEFLENLPDSEHQSLTYPDEKFWRWKMYLRYIPNETKNEFRYKMKVGPKYDSLGRLPITGEDLQLYRELREIKTKQQSDLKHSLKTQGNKSSFKN